MPVIHKKTEITIALTPEEALWLKLAMQYPAGPENSTDFNMRNSFFEVLPDIRELEAMKS